MRSNRPFGRALALAAMGIALAGCIGPGRGGGDGVITPASATGAAKPMDVRRYLGPDYCPELRVRPGSEALRKYVPGHEGDADWVIWQASLGKTARECLYDGQGGLTLRVGVSGRVVAGPKGGPGAVSLPLRIALIKYKEAVLANQSTPLSIAIPPENQIVFNEVRELQAPSPGEARDYLLLVGFDEKGEGLVEARAVQNEPPKPVVKERPKPLVADGPAPQRRVVRRPPPQKPQPQPGQPANVLPVPDSGFVLGQ